MKPDSKGGLRDVKLVTQVPNADLVVPSRAYVPTAGQQH